MKTTLIILIIAIIIGAGIYFLSKRDTVKIPEKPLEPFVNEVIPTTNSNTEQKTHNIAIQSFVFNQKSVTIKKGDTVIWTNNDSAPHTVTSDTGTILASQTLNKNGTYSFTFNTAGTFNYHCAFHPSMKGTIIVD